MVLLIVGIGNEHSDILFIDIYHLPMAVVIHGICVHEVIIYMFEDFSEFLMNQAGFQIPSSFLDMFSGSISN